MNTEKTKSTNFLKTEKFLSIDPEEYKKFFYSHSRAETLQHFDISLNNHKKLCNFYNINNELYFVDLPGYGYAKVSQEVKKKWGKMIDNYLQKSEVLRLLFLLVDIRHEPGQNDKDMYNWAIHYGFNPVIIATKADKITRSAKQKHISMIKKGLNVIEGTPIIPFSALSKEGRDEIYEYIEDARDYFAEEHKE